MNYYISRGGQQYGPYTLADFQRYIQQGNISLNDMARSDGMSDWAPVSQVIGNISAPPVASAPAAAPYSAPQTPYNAPATPYGSTPASNPYGTPATPGTYNPPSNPYGTPATPGYAPQAGQYGGQAAPYGNQGAYGGPQQAGIYPPPPSLHWGIVLLISLFCSIFQIVWLFVELAWIKKVRPQSNAMTLHICAFASIFGGILIGAVVAGAGGNSDTTSAIGGFIILIGAVIGIVLAIMGNFAMRAAIQDFYNREEPVGLHLSPVMTFFFNIFYFQYHFTRITEMKQQQAFAQRASGGGGPYYGR